MSDPQITVELDAHQGPYWPGESISGHYSVNAPRPEEIRAVELSVLWYTLGQGEEDLAVQSFERLSRDEEKPLELDRIRQFSSQLPNSPYSYDGVLVKVCWCVRVRVFPHHGKEVVQEIPFRLGAVPTAQIVPL